MFEPADWTATVKLAVILFFLYVTSPTAAHALIQAAYSHGEPPQLADGAAPPEETS